MKETLLGYEEYFVQRQDLTLWYYKIAVSRIFDDHSRTPVSSVRDFSRVTMPSDRLVHPVARPLLTIRLDVVEQIPLSEYEKKLRKLVLVENLATGAIEPNYILVDLAILVLKTELKPAELVIGGVALLYDLLTLQSAGGAAFF